MELISGAGMSSCNLPAPQKTARRSNIKGCTRCAGRSLENLCQRNDCCCNPRMLCLLIFFQYGVFTFLRQCPIKEKGMRMVLAIKLAGESTLNTISFGKMPQNYLQSIED